MTQTMLNEISYSLFNYQPLNKYIIDGYNMFLSEGLNNIINKTAFTVSYKKEEYQFSFELKDTPTIPSSLATPDDFRKQKTEYTFNLDIKVLVKNTKSKERPTGLLSDISAKIPIMLGSEICLTNKFKGKKAEERSQISECEKDPLGYFIMRFEKALISQEKMVHNFPYTFVKSQEKFCEMLSQNELGFTSKIFVFMKDIHKKNLADKSIYATLSRLNSTKGNNMTILDFLHMYYIGMNGLTSKSTLVHKSRYDIDIEEFLPEFKGSEPNLLEALKDYFGYIQFFIGGEGFQNVDFKLWKHIYGTIEQSQKNQSKLKELINLIYNETSSAPKQKKSDDEEEPVEEEEEVEEELEDDMNLEEEFSEMSKEDAEFQKIVQSLIKSYYFPHIKDASLKNMMLMYMSSKLLLCSFDMKVLDDRDDFSMKKIETPGILIQNLFSKALQIIKKKIIQKIDKKSKERNSKDNIDDEIKRLIQPSKLAETITQLFQHSFVQDTWGDSRTGKKGVAQQVSRHNLASIYSSIRRCSAHSTRQNKIVKPRMIQPSQYMYIAPEETPDNDRIGLMKHFAVSAYVTHDMTSKYINMLTDHVNSLIEEDEESGEERNVWVLMDGNPIGFVHNGNDFRNKLLEYRREMIKDNADEFRFVSIVLADEPMGAHKITMIKINTSGGRLTAPFFTLDEKKKLLIRKDEIFKKVEKLSIDDIEAIMRGRNLNDRQVKIVEKIPELNNFFEYMVNQGLVEYIDSHECQYTNIAVDEEWIKQKDLDFTHMILNPEFMFGVPASLMTFIGHNPAPRISLYDNHIKQAVGVPSFTFQNRMEAHKEKQKVANYPQRRLIRTYMDEIIGTDLLPLTQNALVAIYPFEGQAQEDAMMVKKSSVERGLFSSTIYQTYSIQKPTKETLEKLPKQVRERYKGGIIKEKVSVQRGAEEALKNVSVELDKLKRFFFKNNSNPKIVKEDKKDKSPEYLMNRAFTNLVENYNSRKASMKYDLTRELFSDFCKSFNVQDVLVESEPTEDIPVIQKRTVVGKDEPLAYTKIGAGEGEYLKPVRFEGEYGVVDKIEDYSVNDVHRIRISNFHIAEQGDKIAGPYAQKGIIAALIPDEDMPFIHSGPMAGVKPDVIINPLAFGSRLTIGLLLEAFLGKLVASPLNRKVSEAKEPFHVPFERIGFPVFDCFVLHCSKLPEWNTIKELRRQITRLSPVIFEGKDDPTEKSGKEEEIRKLKAEEMKKLKSIKDDIKEMFEKVKKSFKNFDLTEKDKAFHEKLYGKKKPTLETLCLTFGPVDEHDVMVDNMKMEKLVDNKTFEKFYRDIFANDITSIKDLSKNEKEKMLKGLKELRTYGKAFQKFSMEELKELTKELGLSGVQDQELMVDGKTGDMIAETFYRINPLNDEQKENFLTLALPNFTEKKLGKLNLKQLIEEGMKYNLVDENGNITTGAYEMISENMEMDNYDEIMKMLKDMVKTEVRPTPITVGLVDFLILKHYVHDKIQVRDDGAKDIVTRQPVKGKKNDGGPRFGTMERDALISHGSAPFLQERLFKSVDRVVISFCEKCKHMCTKDKTGNVCVFCKKEGDVVNLPVPYSLKLIADYNTAMGIKNKISFKEIEGTEFVDEEF